ncbi:MAG: hypothetical protein KHZ93_10355 [Clostridiales bacterium]|nr:hypothetical protein [Clostridiales bacterium]
MEKQSGAGGAGKSFLPRQPDSSYMKKQTAKPAAKKSSLKKSFFAVLSSSGMDGAPLNHQPTVRRKPFFSVFKLAKTNLNTKQSRFSGCCAGGFAIKAKTTGIFGKRPSKKQMPYASLAGQRILTQKAGKNRENTCGERLQKS